MRYICTSCTSPTSSLYKVYSTPGSIQLTTCKGCGNDVDPYIEREWLLIVMDCVLHRPEAFRHALYNRDPFATILCAQDMQKSSRNVETHSRIDGLRRLLYYSLIAALFRTYLWHAATTDEEDRSGQHSAKLLVVLFQSLIGENIMAIATILSASIIGKMTIKRRNNSDSSTATSCSKMKTESNDVPLSFFYSRLYLAVTIPSFVHIVTIFAIIWENSATVCLLGTLFVLSLQRIGIATVVDERLRREMNTTTVETQDVSLRLMQSLPLVVGMAAKVLCFHISNKIIPDLDCIGIPIQQSYLGSFCIS